MTPVEAMKISLGARADRLGGGFGDMGDRRRADAPVKALALPELTISARAFPPARCARHQSTGAEGHFERVNTPATAAGSSNSAIITSVRPA